MYLLENIHLAWEGIRTNKMRSLLTMLGIIIGISSVITILTAGEAMTNSVTDQFGSSGTGNVSISVTQKSFDYSGIEMDEEDRISEDMLTIVTERYGDEIAGISYSENGGSGQAIDGKKYANIDVLGINEDYATVNELNILTGRNLKSDDLNGSRNTAIVSSKFVEQMFGSSEADVLGEKVDIYLDDSILTISIIGVYEYVESMYSMGIADEDISTSIYMPYTTVKRLTNSLDGYTSFTVMALDATNVTAIGDNITSMLNDYYTNNDEWHITSFNSASLLESLNTVMSSLSLGLGVIAGISLLVGGIGVMNIMLVSVTERTREIGTRKALGATATQIRVQFIMESLIVCTIGGIIGMVFGGIFGYIASTLLENPSWPSITSILISVIFSTGIGIFFGYYPANKAAKLDPIEALRYE